MTAKKQLSSPLDSISNCNQFFRSILNEKNVNSAHWFRIADLWHRVSFGYNNPLNYGCVHSELMLLIKIEDELIKKIENFPLVFMGIGVGDTETQIVDMQLRKYMKSQVFGVDINRDFLQLFKNSLKQRESELHGYKIKFCSVHKYFEEISIMDFEEIGENQKKIICVLGNTIGNYNDTNDMLKIIDIVSRSGDYILLGYQLNDNIDILLHKYKSNRYFIDFIGNYLPDKNKKIVKWSVNKNNSSIEAWLEDVQIFRSRKFKPDSVVELFDNHSFKTEKYWVDAYKNMCIHFLRKI